MGPNNRLKPVLIAVGVLAFLLFVWPGLYVYSTYQGKTYRTNRLTGTMHVGSSDGWETTNGYRSRAPSSRAPSSRAPSGLPPSAPWE